MSLMRAVLFNELLAGLGTVTVTPGVPRCHQPGGPGPPSMGTELSGQQMDGGANVPSGHYGRAGAEQDPGFVLLLQRHPVLQTFSWELQKPEIHGDLGWTPKAYSSSASMSRGTERPSSPRQRN